MKLMFIGADHEVTGSCHYVEACGKRFIVDYGMEQGLNVYENVDLPVNAGNLDFIMQKGSEERSMRQEQQPIYVRSCCKTVHTFRNLKQNGRTGKQGDLENQKLYRSIRWMMRSMSCSISCHAHMADRLKLLTALRSNLQISDIC